MTTSPEEKLLYTDIQKKLFYIIPEKWECIYLYASEIDRPMKKSIGEMYFYYLPKGIIKKKFVNCYEIPNLFNIDDEQYSNLITDIYNKIKLLRRIMKNQNPDKRIWSCVNIFIEDNQFRIEFNYENIRKAPFDSYERHVIWRHKYLKEDINQMNSREKKIISAYEKYINDDNTERRRRTHIEEMYNHPIKNIIDYEKTLSVEEAIAQSDLSSKEEKVNSIIEDINLKTNKGFFKKKKNSITNFVNDNNDDDNNSDDDGEQFKNQILKKTKDKTNC